LEPKRKSRAGTPITAQTQLALITPAIQPTPHTLPWASSDIDMLGNEEKSNPAMELPATTPQGPAAVVVTPSGYTKTGNAPVFTLPDDPANMEGLPLN